MNMKYGIVTIHGIPNFGAVLQGVALCKYLRSVGIDCEIVDYLSPIIEKNELHFKLKKNIIKTLINRLLVWKHTKKRIKECQLFEKNYLGTVSYNLETIREANKFYDAFIAGSDQIWNFDITGFDTNYLLGFADESKYLVSYASSAGKTFATSEIDRIVPILSRFSYISSREKDTCELLSNCLNCDCHFVPDPTMLLSSKEWDEYVTVPKDTDYVLVYFPYKKIMDAARQYAKIHNKKIVVIPIPFLTGIFNGKIIYSPGEFLGLIKNAFAVFTDSYHGFLFSLYFNKKVWTNNKSNRIASLINELSLEGCYIENDLAFEQVINYDEINKKIELKRQVGIEFLKTVIK